jgi:hypothetical protein
MLGTTITDLWTVEHEMSPAVAAMAADSTAAKRTLFARVN